jgi:hypothetical protein
MSKPTGGPAFPADRLIDINDDSHLASASQGMTIRDWFIGKALQSVSCGIIAENYKGTPAERLVAAAIDIADIALKEREK